MEKIISEKKEDIFISYRRKGGEWFAYVIYLKLTDLGYSCFFDKESLRGGNLYRSNKRTCGILSGFYFNTSATCTGSLCGNTGELMWKTPCISCFLIQKKR